jgi:hypothetical protein
VKTDKAASNCGLRLLEIVGIKAAIKTALDARSQRTQITADRVLTELDRMGFLDAEALAALAANGGNIARTARQLGIPVSTLKRWATGTAHPEANANALPKKGTSSDQRKCAPKKRNFRDGDLCRDSSFP